MVMAHLHTNELASPHLHPSPPRQQERRDPPRLSSRLVLWSELFPAVRVTYGSLTQWPLQHFSFSFFFCF